MWLRPDLRLESGWEPSSQELAIDGAPEPSITMDGGLHSKIGIDGGGSLRGGGVRLSRAEGAWHPFDAMNEIRFEPRGRTRDFQIG